MAGLLKKRKGKAVASSSEGVRFKTPYHEAHYNSKLFARKEISFAPKDIKRVLKLRKDPLPDTASYEERVANKDYRLDHIQEDICIEGGEWVRHKDGRPHYLRRANLEPMTKGWYDFVCRSIMPTTNRSELTVERAILIHSIIIGENINEEEIIAKQFYKFIYKADLSSSLPFPSIIAALCADAKVPAIKNDNLIGQEPAIVGAAMLRTRETRARNPRQEALHNNHHKCNHNHKFTNNKISLQASTLTLMPPCHRFVGGLINNKRKVGGVLRPSTQGWIAWMTS
ncbi:hypothetical protein PIB30_039465 [Stylosanthes scabra]|uniref:Putative plant transposon protein domain-containing protein n=1 Tax=Stylosanthes scabra TaxID=79078 RepID=A0ABU6WEP2_9FABA|nr:hypothetical protein [Stylosanthes scabra]